MLEKAGAEKSGNLKKINNTSKFFAPIRKSFRPSINNMFLSDDEIIENLGIEYYKKWLKEQFANYPIDIYGRKLEIGMILNKFCLSEFIGPQKVLLFDIKNNEVVVLTEELKFLVYSFENIEKNYNLIQYSKGSNCFFVFKGQ